MWDYSSKITVQELELLLSDIGTSGIEYQKSGQYVRVDSMQLYVHPNSVLLVIDGQKEHFRFISHVEMSQAEEDIIECVFVTFAYPDYPQRIPIRIKI